ncbi:hypothetical protein P4112_30380 [Pseudomonas aeruginosa]|nr:hypothetical protein [Pseudomonas aeruginosa]
MRLAGVEAIVAGGLRAHPPHQPDRHGRAAAGVRRVPTCLTLGIDGSETFDVLGLPAARRPDPGHPPARRERLEVR